MAEAEDSPSSPKRTRTEELAGPIYIAENIVVLHVISPGFKFSGRKSGPV